MEKLSGYTTVELNDMENGWYSIIHTDDLEKTIIPTINKLPVEKIQYFEYRIITKTKQIKWVSDKLRLINIKHENDKYLIVGAIQDISQRKSASLALDESKRYLDSIIDNLPIGLHIFDEHGFTARINETQRKYAGVENVNTGIGSFNILTDPLSKSTGTDKIYKEVYEKRSTKNHEGEINFDPDSNRWSTRKGKMTLHTLEAGPETGHELDRWERILDVLNSGEMPPEDEPQEPQPLPPTWGRLLKTKVAWPAPSSTKSISTPRR